MTKLAGIDIGSNSIKLLVLDRHENGSYTILHDESRVTRLGKGIEVGFKLDPKSIEDSLACLADYMETAHRLGASSIRVAGTAALRNATDADYFIHHVEKHLGIHIDILSGSEEAEIARKVALRELPMGSADVILFDLGGGSTELTWCFGNQLKAEVSLELGARQLTEEAKVVHPVTESHRRMLIEHIRSKLTNVPGPGKEVQVRLAGLGGTATQIVWILDGLKGHGRHDPHGRVIKRAELGLLLEKICNLTPEEMIALNNMDPARADVIFAGTMAIDELMAHFRCEEFILLDRGLRFGLVLT
jgi:exopolyphosphatase/guanosine-5'-triphosphate,3'-diphosphate pyrophosphatase